MTTPLTKQQTEDLRSLVHAMNTAGQHGATYQLPQAVALEFARLVRADERQWCIDRAVGFMITRGQDYRQLTQELIEHLATPQAPK